MKKAILATLLALVGLPALATDYLVVVPVAGRTVSASQIQVVLNQTMLPPAQVGAPYSYDFAPTLVVTGDPQFTGAGVTWAVADGMLPAGLSVDPNSGVLRGTPTAAGMGSFSLSATYKTKAGQQAFQLAVVAPRFAVMGSPSTTQSLIGAAMGTASAPSVIQLKNSSSYPGSLALQPFGGADAAQFSASTTCTNVPVNGNCSLSVTWAPTADKATATLVLDGTTYTFNGNMKQFATWDSTNIGGYTLSNNNLTVTTAGGTGGVRATVGKSSGKWYWEVTADGLGLNELAGIAKSTYAPKTSPCFGCDTSSYATSQWRAAYPASTNQTAWGGATSTNLSGTTLGTKGASYGDTYGFALDVDAQTLTVYYTPAGGTCLSHAILQWTNIGAATWYPAISTGGRSWVATANFGAAAFKCPAPTGYQVL